VAIVEGEAAVLGVNLGRPIVTNGDILSTVVRERRVLPKLLWGGLVLHVSTRYLRDAPTNIGEIVVDVGLCRV